MSAYMSLAKVRQAIEKHYVYRRKHLMEPVERDKKCLLVIDDVHLQEHVPKCQMLEFIRTWSIGKGYFDTERSVFKNIGDFGTLMSENSNYRSTYCKEECKQQNFSRLHATANKIYVDEFDSDRYKLFI